MGKAYIHVGFGKTGSSALAKFLEVNRKILSNNGCSVFLTEDLLEWVVLSHDAGYNRGGLYPKCLKSFNDRVRSDKLSPELVSLYYDEIENKLKKNNSENIIISMPQIIDLPYLPQTHERLKVMKKIFEFIEDRYDINIILYCRRQDTWIESLYSESCKIYYSVTFDDFIKCFDPFTEDEVILESKLDGKFNSNESFTLDWSRYSELLNNEFPNYNIITCSYDYDVKFGGLLKNFASITNIENIALDYNLPRENPSMSTLGLIIMQKSQFLNPVENKYLFDFLFKHCNLTKKAAVNIGLFDFDQRQMIYNHYKHFNQKLFDLDDKTYVDLFSPKKDQVNEAVEEDIIKLLLEQLMISEKSSFNFFKWKLERIFLKYRGYFKKQRSRCIIAFKRPSLVYHRLWRNPQSRQ